MYMWEETLVFYGKQQVNKYIYVIVYMLFI